MFTNAISCPKLQLCVSEFTAKGCIIFAQNRIFPIDRIKYYVIFTIYQHLKYKTSCI